MVAPSRAPEARARYYQENREYISEWKRQWSTRNAAALREKRRIYYLKNRDSILAGKRRYHKDNSELLIAKHSERVGRRCDDKCIVDVSVYLGLRALPCVSCGITPARGVDHVVALERGGHHSRENLQAMCQTCNAKKGAK